MHEQFLLDGSIEFRYRANTALLDDYRTPNGVFQFIVDGEDQGATNDYLIQGQWITDKFEVSSGFHTLEWVYLKYINLFESESHTHLAAEIEWIRIVGTNFAPH